MAQSVCGRPRRGTVPEDTHLAPLQKQKQKRQLASSCGAAGEVPDAVTHTLEAAGPWDQGLFRDGARGRVCLHQGGVEMQVSQGFRERPLGGPQLLQVFLETPGDGF